MSVVEREADLEPDRDNRSAMRWLDLVGLWLLGVLLFLLLLVPVLLLPMSTAVPAWIWSLLLLGIWRWSFGCCVRGGRWPRLSASAG
jgi:hypothetical protein